MAEEAPGADEMGNWFRFSVISLDVATAGLREVGKRKWKSTHACDWQDNSFEGVAFIKGGTLAPCDTQLPGQLSGTAGQTVVHTTEDVSALLKPGDCVRFGDFITIVKCDPVSPRSIPHNTTIPGKLKLRDPLPNELQAADGFYSTVRIPKAERYDGKHIDRHVSTKN
jgi:hypothetical protein